MDLTFILHPERSVPYVQEAFSRLEACGGDGSRTGAGVVAGTGEQKSPSQRVHKRSMRRSGSAQPVLFVTDNPIGAVFVDGRSDRFQRSERAVAAESLRPTRAHNNDGSNGDGLVPGFALDTTSWRSKCKNENEVALAEHRPHTSHLPLKRQDILDDLMGSRGWQRPRTEGPSSPMLNASASRRREQIAAAALLLDMGGSSGSTEAGMRPSQSAPLLASLMTESDIGEEGSCFPRTPVTRMTTSAEAEGQRGKEDGEGEEDDEADLDVDVNMNAAELRRLRVREELEHRNKQRSLLKSQKLVHKRKIYEAEQLQRRRVKQAKELRLSKWRELKTVHEALHSVEKKSRERQVRSLKQQTRDLRQERRAQDREWQDQQTQHVRCLRERRHELRSRALAPPNALHLRSTNLAADELLAEEAHAGAPEFPPSGHGNLPRLGGGFNQVTTPAQVLWSAISR